MIELAFALVVLYVLFHVILWGGTLILYMGWAIISSLFSALFGKKVKA